MDKLRFAQPLSERVMLLPPSLLAILSLFELIKEDDWTLFIWMLTFECQLVKFVYQTRTS